MALFTITDAEKVYQRDTVARTAYNRFSKAVLQELCEKNGIIAVNTGLRSHVPTKPDYIKALLFFGKPYQLAKRRLQEVDAEMSCVEPFVSKEAETRSLEADVVMEPEYQLQPVGALVEGEGLAVSLSTDFNETDALPSSSTPPVRIRLYEDAKAWHYLREILFHRDLEGNINLHELKVELAVDGSLHILDPRRRRPFLNHTPGILHADDLEILLADGFLRVTDGLANLSQECMV